MVFMRTRFGRRYPRDEQGAVVVLTALLMVVLVIFAAIVVDLGMARDVRRQSQNGGDAAALAGTAALYPDALSTTTPPVCQPPLLGAPPCIRDAVAAARLYALKNFQVSDSDWNACTATLISGYTASAGTPGTSCISYYPAAYPTKVRVVMPTRTVPTFFGGIMGRSSIPVGSSAEAVVAPQVTCSLCFLGPVDAGNGDFSVTGGSVAVNGSVTAGPGSNWTAQSIGIVGTFDHDANPNPAITQISAFGDPLATSLIYPSSAGSLKMNPCTDGPGVYGAFSAFPNSTCTLQPGLYVVTGKWTLGNFPLRGTSGVTLYATSPSGELDLKNGDAYITAPTAGQVPVPGGLAGYAIIYDRDNVKPLGLQGNGNTVITGAVYAPKSLLDFNGNSIFGFVGGPIVLGGAYTNGTTSGVTVTNAVSIEVTAKGLRLDQ